MVKTKFFVFGLVALSTLIASAAPMRFSIGKSTAKANNLATVESKTQVETIVGKTNNVVGELRFDPATKQGSGWIEVDVASIDTGIPLRNEHMRGNDWMSSDKYPKIRFESTKVRQLKGNDYEVEGKFTLHGVTKNIKVTAQVAHQKANQQTKKLGFSGDVVSLKTKFKVKLADYGIKIPERAKGKVSESVDIALSAVASS